MVPTRATKRRGLAGVQLGGDQGEAAAQLAKVVAATLAGKQPLNVVVNAFVVQQAGGQRRAQALHRAVE
jgi:hypothetical protein